MLIKRKNIRILFIGDSLVNGAGDPKMLGWPGRLCQHADSDEREITCYNVGVRRNTSADVLQRLEHEIKNREFNCNNFDARVVVSFGVNDTAFENGQTRIDFANTIENYKSIIQTIRRYSNIKLLVVGPPAVTNREHCERLALLNLELAQCSKALSVDYIELFPSIDADERYKAEAKNNDGAHPRAYGYERLANIISADSRWWF